VIARRDVTNDAAAVRVNLSHTCLYGADLRGARLSTAVIIASDLTCADLTNADFSHASMAKTDVGNVIYTGAQFPDELVRDKSDQLAKSTAESRARCPV